MSQEKWYQRLIWLAIAAIITVIVTVLLSPFANEIRGAQPTNVNSNRTQAPPTQTQLTPTPTWISQYQPTPTQTQQALKNLYKGTLVQTGEPRGTAGMNLQFYSTSSPLTGKVWYDSSFPEGTIIPESSYVTGNSLHFVYRLTGGQVLTFDGGIQQDSSLKGSYSYQGLTYGTWYVYPV